MIRISKSLRNNLSFLFIIILGFALLFSSLTLYYSLKKSLFENMDETLYTAAIETENVILNSGKELLNDEIKTINKGFIVNKLFIRIDKFSERDKLKFENIYNSKFLIADIPLNEIWIKNSKNKREDIIFVNINQNKGKKHPIRVCFYPVYKKNLSYLISVGTSLKRINITLSDFTTILILFSPIFVFIMGLLGFWVINKAFYPFKLLKNTIKETSLENIQNRIVIKDYKNEIGDLIIAYNEMLDRLNRSIIEMKHFSGNVSHELKTPLTVIRGEIEITLRKKRKTYEYIETLKNILDESIRLENLVEKLLILSQLAYKEDITSGFIKHDLNELILKSYEKALPKANFKKISFIIKKMDSVSYFGDPTLLFHLFFNMIDNAIKFTPIRGNVEISLINNVDYIIFSIKDSGIGIPKQYYSKIFEHFFKLGGEANDERKGSGLGLPIVKWIADIHNISIDIKSKLEEGTVFIFKFFLKNK